jgi:hypothetical protein
MNGTLALSSLMVGLTVSIHVAGLLLLARVLRRYAPRMHSRNDAMGQTMAVVIVVLGLVGIHTTEIWAYAVLYRLLGQFGDMETALYFSTVTFTTLGYGDVVLDKGWRLLAAIEAANGLLLFGWSTAFLITVIDRVPILGHDDRST